MSSPETMVIAGQPKPATGARSVREAAIAAIETMLAIADPTRRIGRLPGWMLPDLESMNCETVRGNTLLWKNVKPNLKISGFGNVIVCGKIQNGSLSGIIDGNRNLVVVGGDVEAFKLRVDMRADGGLIFVGRRTKINSAHIVMGEFEVPSRVLIGGESLISRQITMRATNSHALIDIESGEIIRSTPAIVVEPHVWIGEGATLLKGAQIGAGSIVAAGAMVTGEIPPCATCAGIPAKVIRTGASWTFKLHPTKAEIRAVQAFLQAVAAGT